MLIKLSKSFGMVGEASSSQNGMIRLNVLLSPQDYFVFKFMSNRYQSQQQNDVQNVHIQFLV